MEEQYPWMIELWPLKGTGPAQRAMKLIKKRDRQLHAHITKSIRRLMQREISKVIRARFLKNLKNGLWELAITAHDQEFRMLGPVEYPAKEKPQFVCLHCFIKKEQKLRQGDVQVALERLKEYKNEIR